MKRTGLAVVVALAVCAVAVAQGISIDTAPSTTFTNCSASGSVAQTVAAGTFLFVVGPDEGVFICEARTGTATCASGGNFYPPNTTLLRRLRNTSSMSCRSAGATGDAYFTVAGL